jgi:hypothetical protein
MPCANSGTQLARSWVRLRVETQTHMRLTPLALLPAALECARGDQLFRFEIPLAVFHPHSPVIAFTSTKSVWLSWVAAAYLKDD